MAAHNFVVIELAAVLAALRDDYADGYMKTVQELVHGELFEDFLSMANELRDKACDPPAAVLAGSVLEEHLRQLAVQHGIDPHTEKGRPKAVETLSVELVKVGAFSETQRKIVAGWYGQRTDAAHGHHDDIDHAEVRRMIDGVWNFTARFPA